MTATTVATLIQRTRRLLDDWPELDVLTASMTSGVGTLTVADGTRYPANQLLEIDQEVLRPTAIGSGTSVSVQRGLRGSSPASHVNGSTVLMAPRFFSMHILDELNAAIDVCFPRLYRAYSLDYTGLATNTYEYTIPTVNGAPLPYISSLQIKDSGALSFMDRREWEVVRDATAPYIEFRSAPWAAGTLRINGYGPFSHFSAVTDTVDPFFPQNAEPLLPLYAAAALLDAAEARRDRDDAGAIDNREQATAVGATSRQASKLQQRFYTQLERWAMPPPQKSIRVRG